MELLSAIIFDLEGTLTNSDHREDLYVKKQYDLWNPLIVLDPPNPDMVELLILYQEHTNFNVFILTAKPEEYRNLAMEWIARYIPRIRPTTEILMRPNNNKETSPAFKYRVVRHLQDRNYRIELAIDDRPDICQMFTANYIPALQYHREGARYHDK